MKPISLFLSAALIATAACNGDKGSGSSAATGGGDGPRVAQAVKPPANGDWSTVVTPTEDGGFLMGNPEAKVHLVEFASMTCPHCAEFSENGEKKLVDEYVKSGRVAFEYRNYVRDPLDITMSLIARCGGAQRFFPLTDAMFANQADFFQKVQGSSPEQQQALAQQPPAQQFAGYAQLAGLQEWAALRGVPQPQQQQCLSNQAEIDRLVQMNSDANSNYQITGTPSFLINNELVEMEGGKPLWDQLRAKIEGELG